MCVETLDIEAGEEGTLIETLRQRSCPDVKDADRPVRIVVRQWMDERHYLECESVLEPELW